MTRVVRSVCLTSFFGLLACLTFSACKKKSESTTPSADPKAEQINVPSPKKSDPWIKASPNPVPVSGSERGTTTITWDTGDGANAQVYLRVKGQEDKIFTGGPKGSKEAEWIARGGKYEFVLYAGTDRQKELATVTVTGEGPPLKKKE